MSIRWLKRSQESQELPPTQRYLLVEASQRRWSSFLSSWRWLSWRFSWPSWLSLQPHDHTFSSKICHQPVKISKGLSKDKTSRMKVIYSVWRLAAGARLALQKGLKPTLPQSASLSFKSDFVMSLMTSSSKSSRLCRRGSFFSPV